MDLWRATDQPEYLGPGSCWAEERETAEAYRDNPGFGGSALVRIDVDIDWNDVLDLTGSNGWDSLGRHLGVERPWERWSYIWDAWEQHQWVWDLLVASYRWIRYEDNYPDGAVTWVWLGPGEVPVNTMEVVER